MVFENSVPAHWTIKRLGEIFQIVSGTTPKGLEKVSGQGLIHFYKVSDMNVPGNEVSMQLSKVTLTEQELKDLKLKTFPSGTVIFPKRGGAILTNKKRLLSVDATFDLNLMGLVPTKEISSKYLFYWFQKLDLAKIYDGSNVPQINHKNIAPILFPYPPKEEQENIVQKIDELFSELDKGVEQLETLQQQLKVYRQAVLKQAFEGKLTEEWRKLNPPVQTGVELLEELKEERVKLAKEQGKKSKELADLKQEELKVLPELPESWKWVKVDALKANEPHALKAGPFGSALKKEFYTSSGYKIYGQEQVIADDATIGNYYIDEERFKSLISCRISPQDILISLVGTIGKVLILPEHAEEGIINPRLIKITLNQKVYLSKFFKYYFESSFLKSLYSMESKGTTMDVLNLGIIQDLPFPLCSRVEQDEIIKEIENRLSVCDKLEETIQASLKQAGALRQSILKMAFSGELVEDKHQS